MTKYTLIILSLLLSFNAAANNCTVQDDNIDCNKIQEETGNSMSKKELEEEFFDELSDDMYIEESYDDGDYEEENLDAEELE